MNLLRVCCGAVALFSTSVTSRSAPDTPQVQRSTRADIKIIRRECGLKTDSISYDGRWITIDWNQKEPDEKVDCAMQRALVYGLSYNNPNAAFGLAFQYLVEGPKDRLAVVEREARVRGWKVVRKLSGSDGVNILVLETNPKHTQRQVTAFLRRFRFGDFGDLAVGLAPRRAEIPPPVND